MTSRVKVAAMLRIQMMATGEEVACIEPEEWLSIAGDKKLSKKAQNKISSGNVRTLKLHLQRLCGHPRFRQRLLQEDGQILPEEAVLKGPCLLHLVILGFAETSGDDVDRLLHAVEADDTTQVEAILQRNQDPNRTAQHNMTALHVAARSGRQVAARLLLEAGAGKDQTEDHGATPLFIAAQRGHLEVARVLLEFGADKDLADAHGATPLFIAAENGLLEVTRLLLEFGASIYAENANGTMPSFIAAANGHLEVVRLLLEVDADLDWADACLSLARENGHTEVVRFLLEFGAVSWP